ncbi:MAG: cytochrome c, partial [Polyangiales bacterium]
MTRLEPRLTPLEAAQRAQKRVRRVGACAALLLATIFLWTRYGLAVPVDYDDEGEHFKYGSIGADLDSGLPYWIWRVMPTMCAAQLAARGDRSSAGYEAFGFVREPGHDRPIGFSKRRFSGIELVGLNCAVCHVGTVRRAEGEGREVVLGMPAHQLDLLAYFEFLFDCAADPGFTVDRVLAHIDAVTELGPVERLIYARAVPQVREALLARAGALAPLRSPRFRSGKGRIDTFNPYKALVLDFPEVGRSAPGASDFPSIWNQRPRQGKWLHWDGNNDSLFERNISAAIGAGVTPVSLDLPRVARVAA